MVRFDQQTKRNVIVLAMVLLALSFIPWTSEILNSFVMYALFGTAWTVGSLIAIVTLIGAFMVYKKRI